MPSPQLCPCDHRLREHVLLEGTREPTLACDHDDCPCRVTVAELEDADLWGGRPFALHAVAIRAATNGFVVEVHQAQREPTVYVDACFAQVVERLGRLVPRLRPIVDELDACRRALRSFGCCCPAYPSVTSEECSFHQVDA